MPMRTLVEQTRDVATRAIQNLEAADPSLKARFQAFTLMGGEVEKTWESWPERECLLIGTQDMLLHARSIAVM